MVGEGQNAEKRTMAENVGTLLWELRTTGGWSLAQLAQKAGVSKSALSQWESGVRQPRMPELEATLGALGVSAAQRALVFAQIEAPRALRRLNAPAEPTGLGAPPSSGDLLRAMRLRGSWTQEQVAQRLGVGQNTVARWEQGERLPSNEQMQALCYALEAQEEELIALTTRSFAPAPAAIPTDPEAIEEYLRTLLYTPTTHLQELHFMAVESALWREAAQSATAQKLLAQACAYHAHYLGNRERWQEVNTLAARVLKLTPRQEVEPDYVLRAVLKLAAAAVHAGRRPAPERGIRLLQSYLSHSALPDYTAWILADMAKYAALAGQTERGVALAREAVHVSENEREMRRIDYSNLLIANGQPEEALRNLPDMSEEVRGVFVYTQLVKVKAYLAIGHPSEAHRELVRAYAIIEQYDIKWQREQADKLAQQLELSNRSHP